MHTPGSSWKVTESERSDLCLALCLRDSCGIQGWDLPVQVPPLRPAVAVTAPEPDPPTREAWTAWWQSLVQAPSDRPPDLARGEAAAAEEQAWAQRLGVSHESAVNWVRERKRAVIEGHRRQSREVRLAYNSAVAEIESHLGRPGAFSLAVGVLPVAGAWSWRPTPSLLLVGEDLRQDMTAFRALITPIIREMW